MFHDKRAEEETDSGADEEHEHYINKSYSNKSSGDKHEEEKVCTPKENNNEFTHDK